MNAQYVCTWLSLYLTSVKDTQDYKVYNVSILFPIPPLSLSLPPPPPPPPFFNPLWCLFGSGRGTWYLGACGPVDRAMDSRSESFGFDSLCWPCGEASGKLRIPYCLGPPSHIGHQVHRPKFGSIVTVRCAPTAREGSLKNLCSHMDIWTLNRYLYLYLARLTIA